MTLQQFFLLLLEERISGSDCTLRILMADIAIEKFANLRAKNSFFFPYSNVKLL
jgi:hypothetical protein